MQLRHASLAAACTLLATVAARAADTVAGSFSSAQGTRGYELRVPSGARTGERLPMLVALHGCLQTPEQFAGVARLDELADAERVVVLLPAQSAAANPMRCWNWFDTANQARDAGEASLIKGMVDEARSQHPIDASRVYVAGLSAGGFMTSIMLACYPDVFAAGVIVLGGMYKAAENLSEGMSVPRAGSPHDPRQRGLEAWKCAGEPSPRAYPVLILDGDADAIVGPANALQAFAQFAQTNDLADDRADNDSVRGELPAGTRARPEGRLEYTCRETPVLRQCTVHGLGHAWSGGDARFPYAEPKGPDATAMMWDFMKQHARPRE